MESRELGNEALSAALVLFAYFSVLDFNSVLDHKSGKCGLIVGL